MAAKWSLGRIASHYFDKKSNRLTVIRNVRNPKGKLELLVTVSELQGPPGRRETVVLDRYIKELPQQYRPS